MQSETSATSCAYLSLNTARRKRCDIDWLLQAGSRKLHASHRTASDLTSTDRRTDTQTDKNSTGIGADELRIGHDKNEGKFFRHSYCDRRTIIRQ